MNNVHINLKELYTNAEFGDIYLTDVLSSVSADDGIDIYSGELDDFGKTDSQRISDLLLLLHFLVVERADFIIYGAYPRGNKFVQMNFEVFNQIFKGIISEHPVIDDRLFSILTADFYLEKKDGIVGTPSEIPDNIQKIFTPLSRNPH